MDGKMDNVVFLKVDVDEAEDVAGEYNISAMPTFVFIKDGKKVSASVPVLSVFFISETNILAKSWHHLNSYL